MREGQANEVDSKQVRWMVVILGVTTIVLSTAGWLRWERPGALAPGIPRPVYSVVDASEMSPRGVCSFDLRVEGPVEEVRERFTGLLEAAGWQSAGQDGVRTSLTQGQRTLRITVRPPVTTAPRWSRVRLVATRCRGDR